MIKLIVGNKGSGKTKKLVDGVNAAVAKDHGAVVCVEKGLKLTYDLSHKARLVDIETYDISGFDAFYGFLAGILAGNYDITDMYVDATLKIGGKDLEGLAKMIDKLNKLTKDSEVELVFTVSCDPSELPESLKGYIA